MAPMTDSQRAYLVAGISGAHLRTVVKYLRGEPVKGAHLRERLAAAVRQVDSMGATATLAPLDASALTPASST